MLVQDVMSHCVLFVVNTVCLISRCRTYASMLGVWKVRNTELEYGIWNWNTELTFFLLKWQIDLVASSTRPVLYHGVRFVVLNGNILCILKILLRI